MLQEPTERVSAKLKYIYLLFFFSGLSSLMYEIVWVRHLTVLVGATTFAISAVLTAFMSGLALGSYVFGRLSDRIRRPLYWYAGMEVGIAVFCVLFPLILIVIEHAYSYFFLNFSDDFWIFNGFRFSLVFLALLVPTTLMGGTLPVMCQFAVSVLRRSNRAIGNLYAINTFGAVGGSFLTGFVFLLVLGMNMTMGLAAAINLLVALLAVLIQRNAPILDPVEGKSASEDIGLADSLQASSQRFRFIFWLTLVAFGLSGFCSLAYEVLWTRYLTLIFGGSVYCFSLILIAFLVGIAIGSWLMALIVDRLKSPIAWFGFVESIIGVFALSTVIILARFPNWFSKLFIWFTTSHQSWLIFTGAEFLMLFCLFLIPTLMMGMTFPLVVKICSQAKSSVGLNVGRVYAFNTIGSVLGSFAGGFLLIPILGMRKGIIFCAVINCVLAVALVLMSRKRLITAIAIVFIIGSTAIMWPFFEKWDRELLMSGIFEGPDSLKALDNPLKEIIYYEEGMSATVSVSKDSPGLSLQINGRTNASIGDLSTQLLLAYLPVFLHEQPKTAMVIGLGSGITSGAFLPVSSMERVDSLEISPEVCRAAEFFAPFNYDVMKHPKSNIYTFDGRNFLRTTEHTYDIISSEPVNLWLSGVASLFTVEFYRECLSKLNPGGVMCQWIHLYMLDDDVFKIALNSFIQVFPHSHIWQASLGDILLIGTKEPLEIDPSHWQQWFNSSDIKADLASIDIKNSDDMLKRFLLSGDSLKTPLQSFPVNSDIHPLIEYLAPKGMYFSSSARLYDWMLKHRKDDLPAFFMLRREDSLRLNRQFRNYWSAQTDIALAMAEKDADKKIEQLKKITMKLPDSAPICLELGKTYKETGDFLSAMEWLDKAVKINPKHNFAQFTLGLTALQMGLLDKAKTAFRSCYRFMLTDSMVNLAYIAYYYDDNYDESLKLLNKAINIFPGYSHYRVLKSQVLYQIKQKNAALLQLKEAMKLNPENDLAIQLFDAMEGGTYKPSSQEIQIKDLLNVIAEKPTDIEARFKLAAVYRKMQMNYHALFQYQEIINLSPGSFQAHAAIAGVFFDLEQYHRALEEFQKALNLNPKVIGLIKNIGFCYYQLGEMQQAIFHLEKFIQHSSNPLENQHVQQVLNQLKAQQQ